MKRVLMLILAGIMLVACIGTRKQESNDTIYLYFIRHGKTLFNTTDQVQGWSDSPLTEFGLKGARQVAGALSEINFTLAYSSDLGRARKTAKIILSENTINKPIIVEKEGLREVFYGSYEGKSNYEIMRPLFESKGINVTPENWSDKYEELMKVASEEWMINQYHENDPTHTAENYNQVIKRIAVSIDDIMNDAKRNGGGNILIVTHGEQIALSLSYLLGVKNEVYIENSSITIVSYKNGKYILEKISDTAHIK
ncbi:histidine phosphatase family protein [Vibrio metschnikovii]|uniref:histidine phosphatase family protein n=1 Tax=Vibrio metschnikovii TaxID=28172 RepID=UPI001C2FDB7F|nr:histidine phosphatase family protein [Vibrio metschnikovii]